MRNENEFRRQVDGVLVNMQWTARKSEAVLQRIGHDPKPVSKEPRVFVIAFVLLLVMGMSALAVSSLNRAPEADAVTRARQALMQEYGLTMETLGVFDAVYTETESGWKITFESSMGLSPKRLGVYTVEKSGDTVTASWTHDNVDPAEWADGDLFAPVWGQPQLIKALGAEREAAYRISTGERDGPVETPIPTDMTGASVWNHTTREVEPAADDMDIEEAKVLAQAALAAEFGLTAEQAAIPFSIEDYNYHASQLVVDGDGTRMWELAFNMVLNGTEYNGAVFINSQTGEVEAIEYATLGNG